jgi:methyltransferase (TIGR00027 family)
MFEGRPSLTSMVVAAVRALYAELPEPIGFGQDPLARELLPSPFALPSRVALASPRAGALLHRGLGLATLGLTYHVALRTRAIDDALREGLRAGARQVVLLGAGLDGRAHRMSELEGAVVFEVDHPSTQRDKRARLERSGRRPLARDVRLVPVDFERDDLVRSLQTAGFSGETPSFWIWEGVTVYLTREAIAATLVAIGSATAPGSRVALTYVEPRPRGVEGTLLDGGRLGMRLIGEPIKGFLSSAELEVLAGDARLRMRSDESARAWAERYWPGTGAGPFEWERLAVVERVDG